MILLTWWHMLLGMATTQVLAHLVVSPTKRGPPLLPAVSRGVVAGRPFLCSVCPLGVLLAGTLVFSNKAYFGCCR